MVKMNGRSRMSYNKEDVITSGGNTLCCHEPLGQTLVFIKVSRLRASDTIPPILWSDMAAALWTLLGHSCARMPFKFLVNENSENSLGLRSGYVQGMRIQVCIFLYPCRASSSMKMLNVLTGRWQCRPE